MRTSTTNLTPTTVRIDLKCGKGSISPGEKCHVATAKAPESAAPKRKRAPNATRTEKALKRGGVLGIIGSMGYTLYGVGTGNVARGYAGLSALNASSAAFNYGSSMEYARKGQKAKARQARSAGNLGVASAAAYGVGAHFKRREQVRERKAAAEAKRQASERAKRWQEYRGTYEPGGSNYRGGGYGSGSRGAYGAGAGSYGRKGTARNSAIKDPFKDLGVAETASNADIKKAWLKAMRTSHPDVGGDPEVAKRTNAAYQEIRRRRGLADSNLDSDLTSVWAYGFQP